MLLRIKYLDSNLQQTQKVGSCWENGGGYESVEALQREMFRRHRHESGRCENRMVINIPDGVILIEFTCGNYGYRDYDHGDFMIQLVQKITLEKLN